MNIHPKNSVYSHSLIQDLNFAIQSIHEADKEFNIAETVKAIAEVVPAGSIADVERYYGLGSEQQGLSKMFRAKVNIETALRDITRAIERIEQNIDKSQK